MLNLTPRKRNLLICLALLVATTAVYWPVLFSQFLSIDDGEYVFNNPVVKQGLSTNTIGWAFSAPHSANYHPLTWLSHMLDCQLFGLSSPAHHAMNLALHCINVLLLYLLLKAMTGRNRCSAIVAALFAIHPEHVESVAWVAERKDVLSAMFFLLTLASWTWYVRRSGRIAWMAYITAIVMFAAGLLSKATVVTMPAVLLLVDVWPLGRTRWIAAESVATDADPKTRSVRSLIIEKLPFVILSALGCMMTMLAQKNAGAMATTDQLAISVRLGNVIVSYTRYLRNFVWPAHLSAFYPLIRPWPLLTVLAAVALLAVITIVSILQLRRRPYLAIGWFWFLGVMVPMIGLVQVGSQSMADRYMYLPMIGLLIIVVWSGAELYAKLQIASSKLQTNLNNQNSNFKLPSSPLLVRRAGIAMLGVTLMSFAALGAQEVRWWNNSEVLFVRAMDQTEPNVFALHILGIELLYKGKNDEAIARFEQAVALQPYDLDVRRSLGVALRQTHQYEKAVQQLGIALGMSPRDAHTWNALGHVFLDQQKWSAAANYFATAVELSPGDYDSWVNLAVSHRQTAKPQAAKRELENALALNSRIAQPWFMYGLILMETGDAKDAIAPLRRAVSLDPKTAEAHYRLALALMQSGRGDQALEPLLATIRLNPDSPEPLAKLAWLLATYPDAKLRRGTDAIYFAERANALAKSSPWFMRVLAAAYAEQHQFAQAAKTATDAAQIADASGDVALTTELQAAAARYRAGEATRDASLAGADSGALVP